MIQWYLTELFIGKVQETVSIGIFPIGMIPGNPLSRNETTSFFPRNIIFAAYTAADYGSS